MFPERKQLCARDVTLGTGCTYDRVDLDLAERGKRCSYATALACLSYLNFILAISHTQTHPDKKV